MTTSARLFQMSGPRIAPSILSADFSKLGEEIDEVLNAGADLLHLDVLDGHFAPNISFGPPVIASVRKSHPKVYLDAHLMITDPLRYAPAMVEAGANNVTFHVETVTDPVGTAKEIRKLGCHVGITLNPATLVEAIFPALDFVDVVLVMSVVPGFSGQKFIPDMLGKCETIKRRLRADQRLEIDGGMKVDNIHLAHAAGVDWFVVASAIFDQPDRPAVVRTLRERLGMTGK